MDVAAVTCLIALGIWMDLIWPYYLSVVFAAGLLIYRHRLISPTDLSRMGVAFLRINAYVSMSVFAGTFIAVMV